MKVYVGERLGSRWQVVIREGEHPGDLEIRPLAERQDLRNHSPDGFSWGYLGSGPAQLALAILADATGDDVLALRCYQTFKQEMIAPLAQDVSWSLVAEFVRAWAEPYRRESEESDGP
jgi:hypothetical protein